MSDDFPGTSFWFSAFPTVWLLFIVGLFNCWLLLIAARRVTGRQFVQVTFSRWPWQWYLEPDATRAVTPQGRRYGWFGKSTLLGRFGGGWTWKLGIEAGGSTVILNLLFGTVRITWASP